MLLSSSSGITAVEMEPELMCLTYVKKFLFYETSETDQVKSR